MKPQLWMLACLFCTAIADGLDAADVDFANDIQTVLARRCYACHGPDLQESSLRFDDRSSLLSEADSGMAAVVPGNPQESELLRRISSSDEYERMPPEGKPLSETEIASFRRWIESGAEYTEHWAFQPIRRHALPEVRDLTWSSQPLDQFVLSKLDEANLIPVEAATPQALIRRAFLDVIGLPPSPETTQRLVRDWNAGSYAQLIDQLLADPSFGERWARNWLDVVRYAETNSFERDGLKPNAWRYRDYVIRAMNSDKPYDQFVREQLAGDELDEVTAETLTATGYYRLGLWDDEPADPLQARFDGFDDLVTTTSQGFMGLTLNCARCHDHKIDPLTQKDYYRMVAFMADVTPYGVRSDQKSNNQLDLDPKLARRHDELESQRRELDKRAKKIETTAIRKMPAADQRATEGPERGQVLSEKLSQFVDAKTWAEYQEVQQQLTALSAEQEQLPPRETILGLAQLDPRPDPTHVLMRGSPHAPADEVEPAFPRLLGGGVPEIPEVGPEARSAGRRRVLAEWIASSENWMTARVIVNRIWLHYFGRGIVRSPNNFGLMGEPPTHPELLDFLATELMRNDWQLKSIHRMILLSSTYQLSTQENAHAAGQDPANDLFWRQNLRRLSAEQVRDSVLTVTGQLNQEAFGESMFPTLSAEVLASQSRPGLGWGDSPAAEQARRSIYIHVKRSLPVPMLTAFDFPETDISCEARFLTTQPGQALSMLNSDWMQQQADHLLDRVQHEVGDDLRSQAARCLQLVLSKPADAADIDELIRLTHRLEIEYKLENRAARKAMCLVALNLNEFLYIE